MSDIKNRLTELFSSNENDEPLQENQRLGGITGFGKESHATETRKNTELQRKLREKKRLLTGGKGKKLEEDEIIDPRSLMQISELRLTLKESFLANLIEYLETGKRSYIKDATQLMEEYPNLKEWVSEESKKALPTQPFSVYSIREWFNEDVGSIYERTGDGCFTWSLSEANLSHHHSRYDDHVVLECKVSPEKVLFYIPAFAKAMEELIFSGKINEPVGNPIRRARQWNECITAKGVNSGLVTKINKRGY